MSVSPCTTTEMRVNRAHMRTTKSSTHLSECIQQQQETLSRSPMYATGAQGIPYGLTRQAVRTDIEKALVRRQSLESLLSQDSSYKTPDARSQSRESSVFRAQTPEAVPICMGFISPEPKLHVAQEVELDFPDFVWIYTARKNDDCAELHRQRRIIQEMIASGDGHETELVVLVAKVLIDQGLRDFDSALHTVDQALALYPHDEFCLYSKAELLLTRPESWLRSSLFSDQKCDDWHQAREVLQSMMSPSPEKWEKNIWEPELHANKHFLVWANYHVLAAQYEDASQKEKCLNIVSQMIDQIDKNSVHFMSARLLLDKTKRIEQHDQACHVCTIS